MALGGQKDVVDHDVTALLDFETELAAVITNSSR